DKIASMTCEVGCIGKGIATAFIKAGAKVAIVDVNKEVCISTLEDLKEIQPDSIFVQADLADHQNLKNVVNHVVSTFGKLDVLVNNAHASRSKPFLDQTQADFDLSFNTGFYPTFYLMQAAILD